MDDFSNIFAYQIKEDLAKRYFGCRKKLENDSSFYLASLTQAAEEKKRGIVNILIRIYLFLKDDELCSEFLQIIRFPEDFSHTSLLSNNPDNQKSTRVEEHHGGFTRKQRFKKTLFHLYLLLEDKITDYCDKFTELEEFHSELCTEIKSFHRNFDLQSILQFLREIDDPDHGRSTILNNQPNQITDNRRDGSLSISSPHPPDSIMTPLVRIKPLQQVKPQLSQLADNFFGIAGLS